MSYKELKEVAFHTDPSRMIYHYAINGLLISTKVVSVQRYNGNAGFKINFKGGHVIVWKNNQVDQCNRHDSLIVDCFICFKIG